MNSEKMREQIHAGIDSYCSSLNANPYRVQRVLDAANKEGGFVVRKKLTVGLVITIVLLLTSVTALAIGLANYFIDFAALENTYGEYEQWPVCAKVELIDLMNKNGVLSVEESTIWETAQNAANKETAAEDILAMHFSGMLFVDTYNAMTRELGPIEQWNNEQRALYTSILQKYNKQRTDWPVYMVPGEDDLTREEAVCQAKQAVLSMFSVSEELLNEMVIDTAPFLTTGQCPEYRFSGQT